MSTRTTEQDIDAIKRLVEILGTTAAAAAAIGLSGSAVGKYLKDGSCPVTVRLAAERVIGATEQEDTKTKVFILQVSGQGLKAFSKARVIGTSSAGKILIEEV